MPWSLALHSNDRIVLEPAELPFSYGHAWSLWQSNFHSRTHLSHCLCLFALRESVSQNTLITGIFSYHTWPCCCLRVYGLCCLVIRNRDYATFCISWYECFQGSGFVVGETKNPILKSSHTAHTCSYNSTPQTDTVKYLGLHFDKRLTWREHVTKTRKHLDLKTRELIWLIGKHSPLSLTNKLLIYKRVLTL